MMHPETKYWLWLSLAFGTGNPRVWEVLTHFETAEETYLALRSDEVTGLTASERHSIASAHLEQADGVIEYCERNGYGILTYADALYPTILRNCYNPPLVLFTLGDQTIFQDYLGMTVVGTRRPSNYSIRVAQKLTDGLIQNGITIVSGFALGIDETAHTTALAAGAPTVAVLGSGINVNYPKEHAELKEQMAAARGLLVTEFFPGTQPLGRNFPLRNRILSGLSVGVLIVEAALGSGSLITADYAIEQGRDVFCIPPADIFDRRYAGVIRYLRDGAIPAFTLNDILNEYYTTYPHKLSAANVQAPYSGKPTESAVLSAEEPLPVVQRKEKNTGASKTTPVQEKQKAELVDYSLLDETQVEIVKLLQAQGRVHADVLATELELPIDELLLSLTELELLGVVVPLFGKLYELS